MKWNKFWNRERQNSCMSELEPYTLDCINTCIWVLKSELRFRRKSIRPRHSLEVSAGSDFTLWPLVTWTCQCKCRDRRHWLNSHSIPLDSFWIVYIILSWGRSRLLMTRHEHVHWWAVLRRYLCLRMSVIIFLSLFQIITLLFLKSKAFKDVLYYL